jgi:signal transduction histidine kinase/ligand-binding sensor domain-containing protein/DNA-binding response OmpR family regulator
MPRRQCAWLAVGLMLSLALHAQETFLLHANDSDGQINSLEIHRIIQDREGFIWMATQNGLARYDGYHFKFFRYDPRNPNSLKHNLVRDVIESSDGKYIWATTFGGSLHRIDKRTDRIDWIPIDPESNLEAGVYNTLFEAPDKTVWTAGVNSILRVDPQTLSHEFISLLTPETKRMGIFGILSASDDLLWLASNQGLLEFQARTRTTRHIGDTKNKDVRCLYQDSLGRVLAGMDNALLAFSEAGGWQLFPFTGHHPGTILSILERAPGVYWLGAENGLWKWHYGAPSPEPIILYDTRSERERRLKVNSIFRDRDGGYWIGTSSLGLQQLLPEKFQAIPNRARPQMALRHNTVSNIYQMDSSLLWIGTLKGLQLYDLINQKEIYTPGLDHFCCRITCMLKDSKGHFWIGTEGEGYYRIKSSADFIRRGQIEYFSFREQGVDVPQSNAAMRMMEDAAGNLWVGSFGSGINIRMADTDEIFYLRHREDLPQSISTDNASGIITDCDGHIWISTYGGGLNRYRPSSQNRIENRFEHIMHDPGDPGSLSQNIVLSLHVDRQCRIWAGTYSGGLNLVDAATGKTRVFTMDDGLAGNTIYTILEDDAGDLWLATDNGISQMVAAEERFVNYSVRNGLPFNRHFFLSAHRNQAGRLFFGGIGGLYAFDPAAVKEPGSAPECRITTLKVLNQTVPIKPDGILREDIAFADKISLRHHQKSFSLTLSALSYVYPDQNQYAYRLLGFDEQWSQAGSKREVTFTNLAPGKYRFQYRAADYTGKWTPAAKELLIEILPPWWAAWWAYTLYAALISGLLLAFYRFQLNRRLQAAETRRLRELDAFKSSFYANITHEFRTPLTVISGMADQVRDNPQEWFREGLALIKRNSARLLELVNQMLDLSRLESGKMQLHLQQADIIAYLRYLLESFHSLAQSKQIELSFQAEPENLLMDFDFEKMQQVAANLLSNALKFTPEGGAVRLSVSQVPGPRLLLRVSDTGIGIAPEKLPFIFDRFYQADDSSTRQAEGTGIGLALARELAQLMGGEISVASEPGRGTEFLVALPITCEAPVASLPHQAERHWREEASAMAPLSAIIEDMVPPASSLPERPYLLLVEDHADVVRYLVSCLTGYYALSVAKDGQEGLGIAIETTPDLIVTDVMMPRLDGFGLCQALKKDWRTSHIPIIMLTAKAGLENKLEGLAQGADAYLIKPFNKEELLARIRNLLEQRRLLQQRYLAMAGLSAPLPAARIAAQEDAFVKKVRTVVEAHLDDYRFTVEQLCREAHLSHSQLHRKLTALTGYSANAFIRQVRLHKARELLLRQPEMSITTIALETGFEDPGYFSKVFKKEFGLPPAAWREQQP